MIEGLEDIIGTPGRPYVDDVAGACPACMAERVFMITVTGSKKRTVRYPACAACDWHGDVFEAEPEPESKVELKYDWNQLTRPVEGEQSYERALQIIFQRLALFAGTHAMSIDDAANFLVSCVLCHALAPSDQQRQTLLGVAKHIWQFPTSEYPTAEDWLRESVKQAQTVLAISLR